MKQYVIAVLLLFYMISTTAQQKDQVELNDLRMPVSPGFALLDLSPASIERPTNPKTLALNILNFTGSGTALPKNFALEISPYWMTKHYKESIYKYLGVSKSDGGSDLSTGVLRKLTVSAATYFNDSAKNFLANTNYTSFSVRTNILTYWGKKRGDEIRERLKLRAGERIQIERAFPQLEDPDTIRKKLDSLRKDSKNVQTLSKMKPILSLDAAYAYSDAYFENKYDNRRFNRSAFWINGTFNFVTDEENQHYLFAIVNFRNMQDNLLMDTVQRVFRKDVTNDFGFRAGYEAGDFAVSVEHVSRKYKDITALDSKRTVGMLEYKVNGNLYIYGTFGKNFGNANNLFTMIGINWGWGKKPLDNPKD